MTLDVGFDTKCLFGRGGALLGGSENIFPKNVKTF